MPARLSKAELIEAAYDITGGNVADLQLEQLCRLITAAQFVVDLCLNEIERRGELTYRDGGRPIVPYECTYSIDTVLTRGTSRAAGPEGSPGLRGVVRHARFTPGPGSELLMTKHQMLVAAVPLGLSLFESLVSLVQLKRHMTVAQFVTDLCLNALETRGALEITRDGVVHVPYYCDFQIETVLTR